MVFVVFGGAVIWGLMLVLSGVVAGVCCLVLVVVDVVGVGVV